MKKIISWVLCIPLFLLTGCEVDKLNADDVLMNVDAKGKLSSKTLAYEDASNCSVSKTNLIAGQNTIVGTVTVNVVGSNYEITYEVDNGYCLTETHLSVVQDASGFPMTKNGNPKNGNFEYSDYHGCVNYFTYEIPTSKGEYIAAHGVVTCESDSAEDINLLPEYVTFDFKSQGKDGSYFVVNIQGNTVISGEFPGWCIDANSFINPANTYDAKVLSSYGNLTGIDYANSENLDLVNWVLNQNWEGYTFGEVQMALWILLEGGDGCPTCAGLGTASLDKAKEIADKAIAEGENYEPGCDEYVGIILEPTGEKRIQPIIIPYKLICKEDCEETIWAEGCGFPGNNWAMYFKYTE